MLLKCSRSSGPTNRYEASKVAACMEGVLVVIPSVATGGIRAVADVTQWPERHLRKKGVELKREKSQPLLAGGFEPETVP